MGIILLIGSICPMGSILLALASIQLNPGVQCDDGFNLF